MSHTYEEWELSKENIKPLREGRKTTILNIALAARSNDVILQQRKSFENELCTYSGNDPLVIWSRYIKWVEQNFPKGGREGRIRELIERCLSILNKEKTYHDDDRFIDIMLKYAITGGQAIDVFNYMLNNNIGCKSAKLFINWSWELEQINNFKKADEILKEGIQRRVEPYENICFYMQDFEIRLTGETHTNIQKNCDSNSTRIPFATLKLQRTNLFPVLRIGKSVMEREIPGRISRSSQQQPQPKSITASTKIPFEIYESESEDSSLPVQSQCIIPSDLISEDNKENEMQPCTWNKVIVKSKRPLRPFDFNDAKSEFQIYYDHPCSLIQHTYSKNKIYM